MADRHAKKAGAVFTLKCHLVWCPKWRRKVLGGQMEARPRQLLAQVADKRGMTFHAMEIMPDHVHLFVESDPTLCAAEPDRPKTLAERVHAGDGCGLVLDRDVNAARNMLQVVQGPGTGLQPRSLRVAA